MSKILIVGANGMLGGSLFRYFSRKTKHDVLGTLRSESAAQHFMSQGFDNVYLGVDARDATSVESVIQDYVPDYVLNCIGVIKQVDEAKSPIPSIEINSLLPHRLAKFCDSVGAKLVHFSTDCVFSGTRGAYTENDIPDASDLYGRSKLLGEITYGHHLTLRTSIIGHEMDNSVSLVDWFLNQSGTVKGYSKAIFSGLPTICIAEFLANYIVRRNAPAGLLHLSVDPIDKYSLLKIVAERYDLQTSIDEYADFKIDRSLDSSKLREAVGFKSESWELMIEKMHSEYQKYFC